MINLKQFRDKISRGVPLSDFSKRMQVRKKYAGKFNGGF